MCWNSWNSSGQLFMPSQWHFYGCKKGQLECVWISSAFLPCYGIAFLYRLSSCWAGCRDETSNVSLLPLFWRWIVWPGKTHVGSRALLQEARPWGVLKGSCKVLMALLKRLRQFKPQVMFLWRADIGGIAKILSACKCQRKLWSLGVAGWDSRRGHFCW